MITDFLNRIAKKFQQCVDCFDEFSSAVSEAELKFRSIEEERSSASLKRTARVVGGSAAAAAIGSGIGAGVTLSVIAGMFTFGVGTVVGLSVTAGAAGLASAGVAAATVANAGRSPRAVACSADSEISEFFQTPHKLYCELKSCSEKLNELITKNSTIKE